MALKFAETAYYGFWFSPEMKAMQTFVDSAMEGVTGTARLELYKGNWRISGRRSPFPLYSEEYVTFEDDDVYHQKDAEGFIRLQALRLKLAGQRQAKIDAATEPDINALIPADTIEDIDKPVPVGAE
jgi:argininosuccinate synthase